MEGIVDARQPLSTRVLSRGGRRRNSPPGNARAEGFFVLRAHLIKMRVSGSRNRELGTPPQWQFLFVMLIRCGRLGPLC
jgi:hypothetical protein